MWVVQIAELVDDFQRCRCPPVFDGFDVLPMSHIFRETPMTIYPTHGTVIKPVSRLVVALSPSFVRRKGRG